MEISKEHENLLKNVYYKQKNLFGRDKLYFHLKENYTSYPSRRQVMEWLKNQEVYQLHVRPQRRLSTKSIVVHKPGKYYQADLCGPLPRDGGWNYVFAIIDVHSKMLYTAPLKTKTAEEVANALDEIISENKLYISAIQSDNGSEFKGEFQKLLQKQNIKQILSQSASPWTNGSVERSHKNWKEMLYKYWSITKTKKWKDVLPILVKNINNSFHRSIHMTPNAASLLPPDELKKQLQKNAVKIDEPKVIYKVDDKVRLRLRNDNKLEKGKQYFSNEMYTISRVIKGSSTRLIQYQLRDKRNITVKGYYNESDLINSNNSEKPPTLQRDSNYALPLPVRGQVEVDQLLINRNLRQPSVRGEYIVEAILDARIKNGSSEYLIKWSGYDESMATWEPEGNLNNARELVNEFKKSANGNPKVEATKQKWLAVISDYSKKKLTSFPRGFNFTSIPRKNNLNIIDYYIHLDENLVQPKNGKIRSILDLKRYLEKSI
jgi:transposase InsO family protein